MRTGSASPDPRAFSTASENVLPNATTLSSSAERATQLSGDVCLRTATRSSGVTGNPWVYTVYLDANNRLWHLKKSIARLFEQPDLKSLHVRSEGPACPPLSPPPPSFWVGAGLAPAQPCGRSGRRRFRRGWISSVDGGADGEGAGLR